MRIMAIDYGDARTGVAISDPTGSITGETFVIRSYRQEKTLEEVLTLIRAKNPERIVVGYPKNMNGTIGPRAEKSAQFAELLRAGSGLPVELRDERLTTVDAERILIEAGRHGQKKKATIDAVAASLILEAYLTELKRQS